jgi:transcriptional regulator with XRE-family HTH domain
MLRSMGYAENLRRLCALRGIDQAGLAARVGVSRSSMSRILSGVQEPKLGVAWAMARVLGVSLDSLLDADGGDGHCELISADEAAILTIVRRLGVEAAMDRLLGIPADEPGAARHRHR